MAIVKLEINLIIYAVPF